VEGQAYQTDFIRRRPVWHEAQLAFAGFDGLPAEQLAAAAAAVDPALFPLAAMSATHAQLSAGAALGALDAELLLRIVALALEDEAL
jgi:hypothetical protein